MVYTKSRNIKLAHWKTLSDYDVTNCKHKFKIIVDIQSWRYMIRVVGEETTE